MTRVPDPDGAPVARITIHAGAAPAVEAFLAQRIEEYNGLLTGRFDGLDFSAAHRDGSGRIRAGICGYTWGGCCHITYLWVHEAWRGKGLGATLLAAAEEHARAQRCEVAFVATHSFQAPDFYRRLGYVTRAVVTDDPVGHASIVLAKLLRE